MERKLSADHCVYATIWVKQKEQIEVCMEYLWKDALETDNMAACREEYRGKVKNVYSFI